MRKALIVWGGWPGHEPEAGAWLIRNMLEAGGFAVEVTDDLKAFGRPDLGEFSLVVPNITWHPIAETPISGAAIDNLVGAVRAGLGFATFHGSAVAFPPMVNYHFMMGAQWVQHPGDILDYRVHVDQPADPIMAGIADFDYRSEQYYLHVDPSLDVLATTLFTGEVIRWPKASGCRWSTSGSSAADGCFTLRSGMSRPSLPPSPKRRRSSGAASPGRRAKNHRNSRRKGKSAAPSSGASRHLLPRREKEEAVPQASLSTCGRGCRQAGEGWATRSAFAECRFLTAESRGRGRAARSADHRPRHWSCSRRDRRRRSYRSRWCRERVAAAGACQNRYRASQG